MKKLLLIFLLLPVQLYGQVQQATIKLVDDTFINNAPTGLDWTQYKVKGISLQEASDTLIIDDSEQDKITYYGNWRISTNGIFSGDRSGCNCSWAKSKGDSLVFKFTGTKRFEWYGEKTSFHGIVDLYFDGKFKATIDTYSPNPLTPYRHWFIDNLDTAKAYKFKLVATGGRNINSTGNYIVNQGFMLINTVRETDPIPPVQLPFITDTIRMLDYEFSIIRIGKFKIYVDDSLEIGQHNEYEKSIEHALRSKALNPNKSVIIKSPGREITLQ